MSALVASLVTGGLFVAFGTGRDRAGSVASPSTPNSRIANRNLDIQSILAKAQSSVVAIRTGQASSRGVFGGAGTGVVISSDGDVLTNAHVVSGSTTMRVTLADGTEKGATLVGSLPDSDVALVRIDDPGELSAAELGSSEDVKVGDDVVAIGNALNLGGTPSVTEGIVSAKDRTIQAPNVTLQNLIQTDAAINPGNSGGPLLNAAGQVVAINTAIISDAQNIGFAIPIDGIKPLIDELKRGGGTITPDTAFLGVSTTSVADTNASTLERYQVTTKEGAFVQDVTEGSAAAESGIQPGDVIVKVGGQAVTSSADVGAAIRSMVPGDSLTVEYERNGQRTTVVVTLKSRRDSGG
ncbi:MAG: trypsin-like peptidase domain-containing protein [Acidimicrobiales bacterium]